MQVRDWSSKAVTRNLGLHRYSEKELRILREKLRKTRLEVKIHARERTYAFARCLSRLKILETALAFERGKRRGRYCPGKIRKRNIYREKYWECGAKNGYSYGGSLPEFYLISCSKCRMKKDTVRTRRLCISLTR